MSAPILQTVELGSQWPTLDPFLFCAHHLDAYPAGNGSLGPAAALDRRSIGQDFAGIDGWNMYHGDVVPGFPSHPHRGFETVTYVRRGWCDHADSLGAQARFGEGDAQWLTAGKGIVHSEMFPLLDEHAANPLHLFQIWLNLPAADKMVEPYFSMLWADDIPVVETGRQAHVTLIAGHIDGVDAPAPPPDSWAAKPTSDVTILHGRLAAGGELTLPTPQPGSNRVLYFFEGAGLRIASQTLAPNTAAVLDNRAGVDVAADEPAEFVLLQGQPIGEPVAQHGPFVMNSRHELQQAFDDYQRTSFGGWPWPAQSPTHGHSAQRFARHADGTIEQRHMV